MLTLNLLPPAKNQEIVYEKFRRLTVFVGLILLVQLAVFSALLVSVYFYLSIQLDGLNRLIEAEKLTVGTKKSLELEEGIRQAKQKLEIMSRLKEQSPPVGGVLEDLANLIPAGVQLKSVSLKAETKEVSLAGKANSRADLLNLKSSLESNPKFVNVNLPIAALLRQTDIDFNITFKLQ